MNLIFVSLQKVFTLCNRHNLLILSFILLILVLGVFTNAYFYPNGYLTPDSVDYLRLAKSLLEGKGFDTHLSLGGENNSDFFTTWPVGYPILIAIVAFITNLKVFWASKILSIIALTGILVIFYKLFKEYAWIYALILLNASFLEIFSYTWSEVPFLFGLVLFLYGFNKYFNNQNWGLLLIIISILLLFLTRYIGGFGFIVIGIYLLYLFKNNKKIDYYLFSFTFLIGLICCLYLYHNYLEVGYFSGTSRPDPDQTFFSIFKKLSLPLITEICFPVTKKFGWLSVKIIMILFQIVILILIASKWFKSYCFIKKNNQIKKIWPISFLSAFVYLFVLIVAGFTITRDPFNFRYLSPLTLLLLIGTLNWLYYSRRKWFCFIVYYFFVLGVISVLINIPLKHFYNYFYEPQLSVNYPEKIEKVKARYQSFKTPVLICFGSQHIKYINLDAFISEPFSKQGKPLDAPSMNHFLESVKQFKGKVFVEIVDSGYLQNNNKVYHPSVKKFMKAKRKENKRFVEIKKEGQN